MAQRDLDATTIPLARVSLRGNRRLGVLYPGAVFKLEWPAEGFDPVIMRVISINRGLLTRGEISLECIEDVFGMPASSYVAPIAVGWTDPRSEPAEAAYRITEEATRYELSQQLPAAAARGAAPTTPVTCTRSRPRRRRIRSTSACIRAPAPMRTRKSGAGLSRRTAR